LLPWSKLFKTFCGFMISSPIKLRIKLELKKLLEITD